MLALNLRRLMKGRFNSVSLSHKSHRHGELSQRTINNFTKLDEDPTLTNPTLGKLDILAATLGVEPYELIKDPSEPSIPKVINSDLMVKALKEAVEMLFDADLIEETQALELSNQSEMLGVALALSYDAIASDDYRTLAKGMLKLSALRDAAP